MHAWQHENVLPDLQTIGKGLCGGYVPFAGLLINNHVIRTLEHGTGAFSHGHTFQGHPIACAAALEVQRIIKRENIVANVTSKGELLHLRLEQRLGKHPNVGNIRGKGLFWGIELVQDRESKLAFPMDKAVAMSIHELGLTKEFGISLYPGTGSADRKQGDHVILAPPLNVSEEQITQMAEMTQKVIERYFGTV